MNDKLFLLVMRVFGSKLYELHVGFAAMFNICTDNHTFSERAFHAERHRIEALPDFQKLREILNRLSSPMQDEELEKLLREYEGPIQ